MTTVKTLIHSARLVTGGQVVDDAWVFFDGPKIGAVGAGRLPDQDSATILDAAGRWLTPGFVDIHCHGGAGESFDGAGVTTALDFHRRHGTTRTLVSLVTASLSDLERQLGNVAKLTAADPLVLGAHLEGPFLDNGHRGAHDPDLLRDPDPETVDRILAAGGGIIRQVTLAPELPGALEALRRFSDAGMKVAIGHTGAGYEAAIAAFDAGASILTHAFNAMAGIHHRSPGPVVAAMHTPGVTLEIINDGVHVHPAVVRLAFAGAPDRIALITDAMAAAGSSSGEYILGSQRVVVSDGVARLADGGSIAGSTLTMDASLRRAVMTGGVPVEVAVKGLTETPARAIGRGHDLGSLDVGYAADAVLLETDFTVAGVWAAGARLS